MGNKWILLTVAVLIIVLAVLYAVAAFAWMIYLGVIAGCVTLGIIYLIKFKKWLNSDDQQ